MSDKINIYDVYMQQSQYKHYNNDYIVSYIHKATLF